MRTKTKQPPIIRNFLKRIIHKLQRYKCLKGGPKTIPHDLSSFAPSYISHLHHPKPKSCFHYKPNGDQLISYCSFLLLRKAYLRY